MANKVRTSYRIDSEIADMISVMADKYKIDKTLVVEIAVRLLNSNQAPLIAAFPTDPTKSAIKATVTDDPT